MAFNKLESSNNQEIISEEVGILKELLDDATRGMAGEQGLTTIQHLVELYDEGDYEALTQAISEMTNDDMVFASRYFSLLPLLINISEDVDLAYEVNRKNNIDESYLGKLSETFDVVAESDNAQRVDDAAGLPLRHLQIPCAAKRYRRTGAPSGGYWINI